MKTTSRIRTSVALATIAATTLALGACAPNISPNSYRPGNAQRVESVDRGTVVSYRQIDVEGTNSGLGTLGGAAAGGLLGSGIGKGFYGPVLGALGGAVIGGVAGNQGEKALTSQTAYEYIVRKDNGGEVAIVQKDASPLFSGQRVNIIYGQQARIIPTDAK